MYSRIGSIKQGLLSKLNCHYPNYSTITASSLTMFHLSPYCDWHTKKAWPDLVGACTQVYRSCYLNFVSWSIGCVVSYFWPLTKWERGHVSMHLCSDCCHILVCTCMNQMKAFEYAITTVPEQQCLSIKLTLIWMS